LIVGARHKISSDQKGGGPYCDWRPQGRPVFQKLSWGNLHGARNTSKGRVRGNPGSEFERPVKKPVQKLSTFIERHLAQWIQFNVPLGQQETTRERITAWVIANPGLTLDDALKAFARGGWCCGRRWFDRNLGAEVDHRAGGVRAWFQPLAASLLLVCRVNY